MPAWWNRMPWLGLTIAWILCLPAAGIAIYHAWINLDDPTHPDGNRGHVNIDFAGQYLQGRMLLAGHARGLYDRHAQALVLARMYPQVPDDRDDLSSAFLGSFDRPALRTLTGVVAPFAADSPLGLATLVMALPDDATLSAARRARQLGGPLYPPIHAYVMAPLALLPAQTAYRVMQLLNLALVFVLGFGASRWSEGRIAWPVASLGLMLFPGFAGTLNLGQNPLLSLALLSVGWWLVSRGRPGWAGIIWGLLAFKPVWAVTHLVAALATRRWRLAVSMSATGLALILLTLPLGGLQPWFDWLEVGRSASELYERDTNWVHLSRDVQNLPRRVLLDFPAERGPATSRWGRLPDYLGQGLLAGVILTWVVVLVRTPRPGWDGRTGAFTLLGAWLACWHFMYYDTLLAALPVFLLVRNPSRASGVAWLALVLLVGCHYLCEVLDPRLLGPPCDTLLLLGLWLYSAWPDRPTALNTPGGSG